MIRFKDIEIKFGDFVAIRNLNLQVNKGEFFTFLGPSGCGKTTTLRALVGFIKPTRGSIVMAGEDITYKPVEKRGIGMVFQSYALFPTMNVEENISFGLKENKVERKKIEKRVKEVSEMVNLTPEQLKKNVAALSGGQQQRVAIARALALNPQIIVLDEPLSNLDAKLRKSLRVELKKIQKASGTTMIYVTHDQEEALTLSDRIAVFNNGCVEQVGTPKEIYYHPRSEFVTSFIGDTNKLTKRAIQKLNEQNSCRLNLEANIYIRVENMKNEVKPSEEKQYYHIDTIFDSGEFYGITTRNTFQFEDMEIKSVNEKISDLVKGQNQRLYIKPENLIVFQEE